MELRQLRYFLAVAEHLHFSLAAEKIGIAQPPLSQQILKLEREVGTALFIRHARRVELTDAGKILQENARTIIAETERALVQVKLAARGETGKLSIGFAGSTVFHSLVAKMMREFRQRYAGVEIKPEESSSTALVQKVMEGQLDCAFVRLPLNCHDLQTAVLVEEDMLAVLPADHPLGETAEVNLSQLALEPLVLFPRPIGPSIYDRILNACAESGFSPHIALESPQLSSAINMVAAGFGITLIPRSICQIQSQGVTYHRVVNQMLNTTIALVYRPREKSLAVLNFVKALHQTLNVEK
ncbi:LysR family transcriptional regulator [Rouxiella sp. Mn2063]|uniref:LysR family transcriptional regulator n=1 Tax=Rouxiella sp. Mn2063 TaxID=3395262 RepID=UPI003BC2D17C